MTDARWIRGQPMAHYLADRDRSSGSSLRMAGSDPELYGQWAAGESVDQPSAAKAQGSLTHLTALGPGSGSLADFAFYPNRCEALTEEKELKVGPRGGKAKMVKTSRHVPQDASDAGRYKTALRKSDYEKAADRAWRQAHEGKTIVYPESQPIVQAMARAIRQDPHASVLLVGADYEPEVTGHWHSESGKPCRIRLDGLRRSEDIVIELKTVNPGKFGRLDTSNPAAVMRWAKDGFAVKSAMLHDGFQEIEGRNCTVVWILVEAVKHCPRVSVVYDEAGSTMHEIGREGYKRGSSSIVGYLELLRVAARLRESRDFRHPTVREPQSEWAFPEHVVDATMELAGMTEVPDGPG